ncbi:hypothetical protein L5515_008850 [Caenorhabditis briggsae]|uniref:Uncharacterized protein n=1 Tax=Caenorhabditis briggsae TaxID=6238 RepID=A0AAE9F6M2_CAEBR|nr:hypothetical protein L5515_008850 [Caenorhabditis briggsae]
MSTSQAKDVQPSVPAPEQIRRDATSILLSILTPEQHATLLAELQQKSQATLTLEQVMQSLSGPVELATQQKEPSQVEPPRAVTPVEPSVSPADASESPVESGESPGSRERSRTPSEASDADPVEYAPTSKNNSPMKIVDKSMERLSTKEHNHDLSKYQVSDVSFDKFSKWKQSEKKCRSRKRKVKEAKQPVLETTEEVVQELCQTVKDLDTDRNEQNKPKNQNIFSFDQDLHIEMDDPEDEEIEQEEGERQQAETHREPDEMDQEEESDDEAVERMVNKCSWIQKMSLQAEEERWKSMPDPELAEGSSSQEPEPIKETEASYDPDDPFSVGYPGTIQASEIPGLAEFIDKVNKDPPPIKPPVEEKEEDDDDVPWWRKGSDGTDSDESDSEGSIDFKSPPPRFREAETCMDPWNHYPPKESDFHNYVYVPPEGSLNIGRRLRKDVPKYGLYDYEANKAYYDSKDPCINRPEGLTDELYRDLWFSYCGYKSIKPDPNKDHTPDYFVPAKKDHDTIYDKMSKGIKLNRRERNIHARWVMAEPRRIPGWNYPKFDPEELERKIQAWEERRHYATDDEEREDPIDYSTVTIKYCYDGEECSEEVFNEKERLLKEKLERIRNGTQPEPERVQIKMREKQEADRKSLEKKKKAEEKKAAAKKRGRKPKTRSDAVDPEDEPVEIIRPMELTTANLAAFLGKDLEKMKQNEAKRQKVIDLEKPIVVVDLEPEPAVVTLDDEMPDELIISPDELCVVGEVIAPSDEIEILENVPTPMEPELTEMDVPPAVAFEEIQHEEEEYHIDSEEMFHVEQPTLEETEDGVPAIPIENPTEQLEDFNESILKSPESEQSVSPAPVREISPDTEMHLLGTQALIHDEEFAAPTVGRPAPDILKELDTDFDIPVETETVQEPVSFSSASEFEKSPSPSTLLDAIESTDYAVSPELELASSPLNILEKSPSLSALLDEDLLNEKPQAGILAKEYTVDELLGEYGELNEVVDTVTADIEHELLDDLLEEPADDTPKQAEEPMEPEVAAFETIENVAEPAKMAPEKIGRPIDMPMQVEEPIPEFAEPQISAPETIAPPVSEDDPVEESTGDRPTVDPIEPVIDTPETIEPVAEPAKKAPKKCGRPKKRVPPKRVFKKPAVEVAAEAAPEAEDEEEKEEITVRTTRSRADGSKAAIPAEPEKKKRKRRGDSPPPQPSQAIRAKRLYLSKNNPVPIIRAKVPEEESTPATPIRQTGVLGKEKPTEEEETDMIKQLPAALQHLMQDEDIENQDEDYDGGEAIKSELVDECWVAPAPVKPGYRKSRKRQRAEQTQRVIEGIKREVTVDPEVEVTKTLIREVKTEVDTDILVLQATYNISDSLAELEPEMAPVKFIDPNGEKNPTHKYLVTKKLWEGANQVFLSDPKKFSQLVMLLNSDVQKKGRVFNFSVLVEDRTSEFEPALIDYLSKSPRTMTAEQQSCLNYMQFSKTFRSKASIRLNDCRVTAVTLHPLLEKISEIKKEIMNNTPSGLIGEGERDTLVATEALLSGQFIESCMKMASLSQVAWATEAHLKRRLEMVMDGWTMFLRNGGFFRVLLALQRGDVKPIRDEFRTYCIEYLADIEKNYEIAKKFFAMNDEGAMEALREETKLTVEDIEALDTDICVESSESHTFKCSTCFCQGQNIHFSSKQLLNQHEKIHSSETEECGKCYEDLSSSDMAFHRILHHDSMRVEDVY